MKKIYSILLTNSSPEDLCNLFIRYYDKDDISQTPYINAYHLNIKKYTTRNKFDYKKLRSEFGTLIPFRHMVKNYEFSKKEFIIMYKIIKAFCNNSYYKFQFNIEDTTIEYIIVGWKITQIKKSKNRYSSEKLNIYNLKNLLDFFSFQFYIKSENTIIPIELEVVE